MSSLGYFPEVVIFELGVGGVGVRQAVVRASRTAEGVYPKVQVGEHLENYRSLLWCCA